MTQDTQNEIAGGENLPEGFQYTSPEDMTREELLLTIAAAEDHHNEHHRKEDELRARERLLVKLIRQEISRLESILNLYEQGRESTIQEPTNFGG